MKITVNGAPHEIAAESLHDALNELGYAEARVATAVNENFVPSSLRADHRLEPGDRLEILAPMQGG
ncbi:sulfur carrier protein ThiS [Paracoccus caeni]|uniref:Sulfur carrier protein ThiS n=1 Tax=Paracoccus caeni TaxID=657651 RepID=A0A934SGC7_9RHOB|nr:sulfur carrier protein ThiS [Paracoccus caeni]MBK4217362.1 sulfur carrier protein ThiS [Paracoccus caeni]